MLSILDEIAVVLFIVFFLAVMVGIGAGARVVRRICGAPRKTGKEDEKESKIVGNIEADIA